MTSVPIPEDQRKLTLSTIHRLRGAAFHPYLISLFPVFSLYAVNVDEVEVADTLLPLLAALAFAIATHCVLRVICRNTQLAAIATSCLIVMSFAYGHFSTAFVTFTHGSLRHRYFFLGWWLTIIITFELIRRAKRHARTATKVLNGFSCVLLGVACMLIGKAWWTSYDGPFAPESVRQALTSYSEEQISLDSPEERRDIYYLIFDRYSSNEVLRSDFGFDNASFYEQLRQRGFMIADSSRANYPKTVRSMASALNMTYHPEIILSDKQYSQQIQGHRVGKLLSQQGYTHYHLGNFAWFLRANRDADYNFPVSPLPSKFADMMYSSSCLGYWYPLRSGQSETWRRLDALKTCASAKGPKFVYAHFLIPHGPWRFAPDGSFLEPSDMQAKSAEELYVDHLRFTNDQIIDVVDHIKSVSEVSPIIIIQSDEGPGLTNNDTNRSFAEKARKRLGIISAFHLPGVRSEVIPNSISPVNTFRLIFREYFGADIELFEDRSFYWRTSSSRSTDEVPRYVEIAPSGR